MPGPREGAESREAHLREDMAAMEVFYKRKLADAKSQLMRAENELKSFKDRMAEDLATSLDAAQDTENMTSPVNLSRLQEIYHHLRINKWPRVKVLFRQEEQNPERARNIFQGMFQEAVAHIDFVTKPFYTAFTENMGQKELPEKVQDHLRCCLDNLQLALFHSNKEGLRSAAVMEAPEVCRELFSECYWLFCLMVLSKTPVQPDWDKLNKFDSWECLPSELKHCTGEDLKKPGGFILHQQISSEADQICQTPLDAVFTNLENYIAKFVKEQLKRFQRLLTSGSERSSEHPENTSEKDERSSEAVLDIVLDFLRRMNKEHMAERLKRLTSMKDKEEASQKRLSSTVSQQDHLINRTTVSECQKKLKSLVLQRFTQVYGDVDTAGHSTPLWEIYTELYLAECVPSEFNQRHKTGQLKSTSSTSAVTPLALENLFKQIQSRKQMRIVLTEGEAGAGKTLLTQKFSLDWAKDRSHQEVDLLFHFTFRELNVLKDRKCSLVQLIHSFIGKREELCSLKDLQLLFIFDSLDECRLFLDFRRTRVMTEPTEIASVQELLVNLIRGDLLPSARIWITTRPVAANEIPPKYISFVTEVQGFTNTQKEQYFMKRFRDEQQARANISQIKNNPSLSIMCCNPGFCSILSNFIKTHHKLPTTLTNLYIHFLQENFFRNSGAASDANQDILLSAGKLVFEQLKKQKRNLTFHEFDLREFGLDDSQIVCLKYPNVLEFLAAIYVHYSFFIRKDNLLSSRHNAPQSDASFCQNAVDWAVNSSNGHLDMFLRFLLGLSLSNNQMLLSGLLTKTGNEKVNNVIFGYVKEKLYEETVSKERRVNLLHCLNELKDCSLIEEIQKIMSEETHSNKHKSTALWSALLLLLLSSNLEEFVLRSYCPSEEGLQRLLPVVEASKKANLSRCNLTVRSCRQLASVLPSSNVTHLDLSRNDLQDSGVEALCPGLRSSTCRVKELNLSSCGLTSQSCDFLASVLSCSSLALLDLGNNDLRDSGVEQLCKGLKSSTCRLETLRLSGCLILERGGSSLASALSFPSKVKELDLSYNDPGPSMERLTALQAPNGPLCSIRLEPVGSQFLDANQAQTKCVQSKCIIV